MKSITNCCRANAKDFKNLVRITVYEQEKWIKVQKLQASLNPALRGMLDAGEASVIQLASDVKTDFVLIDERKARIREKRDVLHYCNTFQRINGLSLLQH